MSEDFTPPTTGQCARVVSRLFGRNPRERAGYLVVRMTTDDTIEVLTNACCAHHFLSLLMDSVIENDECTYREGMTPWHQPGQT